MLSNTPKILAIDDEETTRRFLKKALPDLGYEVTTASTGQDGITAYKEDAFDVVLVDLALGEMNGIEVIQQLREHSPSVTAIIMTGYASIDSAIKAMKAGAVDYLTKPCDLDHLEIVLKKALDGRRQTEKLHLLEEQIVQKGSFEGLIGVSQPMQQVYNLMRKLSESDATVLIQGETGTGKEKVSRGIHNRSHRKNGGFVPINCGALPESILESELFGHEKGAFTDAIKQKFGLIEQAEGGTLFLDEIEEMSPALQVKLLRAIQEREVMRVGGTRPIPVDFRLIAATNVNLRQKMERGTFRQDLFYRLSVVVVDLPPLRARTEDIPLLTSHFLVQYAEKNKQPVREMMPEAIMILKSYAWPGNVRELENTIEQAVLLSNQEVIAVNDLPDYILSSTKQNTPDMHPATDFSNLSLREARERFERRYLEDLLNKTDGVIAEAARQAGIQRQHLYKKMKQYDISRK